MAGHVLLVAMPWQILELPSIQLGLLQAVLDRAGIPAGARSLKLDFMEHCRAATADRPEPERIGLADYERVAAELYTVGLGDWIFAVPPFRDAPELDREYLAFVRGRGLDETHLAKALAMRALVPAFLDRCVDEIRAAGPRVVGFTSAFSQNVPSLALAQRLKLADPSLAVVFGGANCDGPMGEALHRAFPWVDVVVRGEAERVLPGLVEDLLAGRPVRPQPGLCYRGADGAPVAVPQRASAVVMDEVPAPSYGEYFERLAKTSFAAELAPEVQLVYEASRGCWWGATSHCTFCGLNGTAMAYRSKRADRVLEDLDELTRRHRRLDVLVVDNILDLGYLRDVLPRLRDGGRDLRLFFETKANLRREQVRLLAEAGVTRVQPGIESLSTPILKLMRKGTTALQNVRFLTWCAQYGVRPIWNVIAGFPGEPAAEYQRMADLVPSLTHLEPPSFASLEVHRFSPYHERARALGIELLGPLPYYRLIYPTDAATLEDLAYAFDYRHADGRDPEAYVNPLREAVEWWRAVSPAAARALRYRRGPDFLTVRDRRPGLPHADYTFEEAEARLYLACVDGATAAGAHAALTASGIGDVELDEVEAFLEELRDLRLVFAEGGRYLALALPGRLPEAA